MNKLPFEIKIMMDAYGYHLLSDENDSDILIARQNTDESYSFIELEEFQASVYTKKYLFRNGVVDLSEYTRKEIDEHVDSMFDSTISRKRFAEKYHISLREVNAYAIFHYSKGNAKTCYDREDGIRAIINKMPMLIL